MDHISLQTVIYRTTGPVIIRVDPKRDGENCKKIVGGPYRVTVSRSNLAIQLVETTGCFGWNNGSVWIHPHSCSFGVPLDSFQEFSDTLLSYRASACLGEAGPPLYKAFDANDPKMAVFAAMTWVSSANSADTWGKNYKYFPKLSDVNISGESKAKPVETAEISLSSQDGMATLAEDLASHIEAIEEAQPEEAPTPTIIGLVAGAGALDETVEIIRDSYRSPIEQPVDIQDSPVQFEQATDTDEARVEIVEALNQLGEAVDNYRTLPPRGEQEETDQTLPAAWRYGMVGENETAGNEEIQETETVQQDTDQTPRDLRPAGRPGYRALANLQHPNN